MSVLPLLFCLFASTFALPLQAEDARAPPGKIALDPAAKEQIVKMVKGLSPVKMFLDGPINVGVKVAVDVKVDVEVNDEKASEYVLSRLPQLKKSD
ncbi:hypothetical protein QR680_014502 [Steinernema hermaphroditum]|uniref:Uncharacterized protein n=1 Tax=Steinernema hermaphroditum TaxID=289476 RepID=A0AA39IB93_9BILA|nr:hypothetical protein QR680_014502 [Steinernema hermaphroditum]